MTRRPLQLRLSRPAKKARVERLTYRQEGLLGVLRWTYQPCDAEALGSLCGYAYPARALDRLVARGLAVKVSPGLYRAKVITERRA